MTVHEFCSLTRHFFNFLLSDRKCLPYTHHARQQNCDVQRNYSWNLLIQASDDTKSLISNSNKLILHPTNSHDQVPTVVIVPFLHGVTGPHSFIQRFKKKETFKGTSFGFKWLNFYMKMLIMLRLSSINQEYC